MNTHKLFFLLLFISATTPVVHANGTTSDLGEWRVGMDVRSFGQNLGIEVTQPVFIGVQGPLSVDPLNATVGGNVGVTASGRMGIDGPVAVDATGNITMSGDVTASITVNDVVRVGLENKQIRQVAIPLYGAIGFAFGLKYFGNGVVDFCSLPKPKKGFLLSHATQGNIQSGGDEPLLDDEQEEHPSVTARRRAKVQMIYGTLLCASSAATIALNDIIANIVS